MLDFHKLEVSVPLLDWLTYDEEDDEQPQEEEEEEDLPKVGEHTHPTHLYNIFYGFHFCDFMRDKSNTSYAMLFKVI